MLISVLRILFKQLKVLIFIYIKIEREFDNLNI